MRNIFYQKLFKRNGAESVEYEKLMVYNTWVIVERVVNSLGLIVNIVIHIVQQREWNITDGWSVVSKSVKVPDKMQWFAADSQLE